MTPTELQEGITRAFREFYSPREGLRRLFVKAPKRFYHCLIRFLGRRLFLRIMRETLPHRRALYRLNDWLGTVEEFCSNAHLWLRELNSKLSGASAELPDKFHGMRDDLDGARIQLLENLEQRMQCLREGLEALAESYHPFCRRLLDELRSRFHSEIEAALAYAR
jgi:DNA-binding GntR family transcriptional regulator